MNGRNVIFLETREGAEGRLPLAALAPLNNHSVFVLDAAEKAEGGFPLVLPVLLLPPRVPRTPRLRPPPPPPRRERPPYFPSTRPFPFLPDNRPPLRAMEPCDEYESAESVETKIQETTACGTLGSYLLTPKPSPLLARYWMTSLHLACMDFHGERGEAKINLLLQAATTEGLPLERVASVRTLDQCAAGSILSGHTPLHRLMLNPYSTTRSVELICNAWRDAIFAETNAPYRMTPLELAFARGVDRETIFSRTLQRLDDLPAKIDIILKIAHQVPNGASTLISHRGYEGRTALRMALGHPYTIAVDVDAQRELTSHLNVVCAQLLQACPSAIHIIDDGGCNPLHGILCRTVMTAESKLDIVRTMVTNTTEACLVAALATELRVNRYNRSSATFDTYYANTPIDLVRDHQLANVELFFIELARSVDPNGWTLLHYTCANVIRIDDCRIEGPRTEKEERHADQLEIMRGIQRRQWPQVSRLIAFFEPAEHVAQRPLPPAQPEAPAPLLQEQRRGTKKLIHWLLEVHPDAASTRDSSGRLPIHLAVETCKEWENGVESLTLAFRHGASIIDPVLRLYPFMSAATGVASDLDSIFELLRYAPNLVAAATANETV